MPQYMPPTEGVSVVAWIVLLALAAGLLYVTYENPIILLFFIVFAIYGYIDNIRRTKKFNKLIEERKELNICQFARSFDCRVIDTWVIRAVYEQIQEYVSENNKLLAIKAEDDLLELLEIDGEDLELDMLEEIAQRTGRSIENTEKNSYFNKVNTVSDLVHFINEQPLIKNT